MATKKELKEIIVDLQVENAKLQVQKGNCPFAFFQISQKKDCGCDTDTEAGRDCDQCSMNFWEQFRKDRAKEAEKL